MVENLNPVAERLESRLVRLRFHGAPGTFAPGWLNRETPLFDYRGRSRIRLCALAERLRLGSQAEAPFGGEDFGVGKCPADTACQRRHLLGFLPSFLHEPLRR